MRYKAPSAFDKNMFRQGKSSNAYEYLGAHPSFLEGKKVWNFSVWAPRAKEVSLVGEFCKWNPHAYPMEASKSGIWALSLAEELFFSSNNDNVFLDTYKYAIVDQNNKLVYKSDPYGFFTELRPNTASRLYDLDGYNWNDDKWMKRRKSFNPYSRPINIYEVHLGSWKRKKDGSFLNYIEIAKKLIAYVKKMSYTHIELLPVMEHPLDTSWGYQVTGYYSATSRYGEPKELMAFIDLCHQADIGVILDWVPSHFPRDEAGLRHFDGRPCYEHQDTRRSEMPQWGTMYFDFEKGEVCSFLLSNACFWLKYFHVDGLRVDAVSSMLYYSFSKEEGQWLPNKYGGQENFDAISFLKRLNETVYRAFPGIIMAAEEATTYPMVTKPTYMGGLGFGFKWNMGWMNDTLAYIETDPTYRKWEHNKMTFSLHYAFNENFILPFSHDEVVHGKKSMLDKQPGDIWQKFASLKALYGYTMAHPGKKLLFMGSEFGQFIEWKYSDQLDWFLLVYERHPELHHYVKRLNYFYKSNKPFFEIEDSWNGFQWLVADDKPRSIFAFIRTDKAGRAIICLINFTAAYHEKYRLGLPFGGYVEELLNSDRAEFGGSDKFNPDKIRIENRAHGDFDHSIYICVPPLSCVYYEYLKKIPPKAEPFKTVEGTTTDTKKVIPTHKTGSILADKALYK